MTERATTWEARMAAKAAARRPPRHEPTHPGHPEFPESLAVREEFIASRPDLRPEDVAYIRDAPTAVYKSGPDRYAFYGYKPYDPAEHQWSAAEVWAQFPPGECRTCWEPRSDQHWGWKMFLTCGHCDHAHHAGEVWLA